MRTPYLSAVLLFVCCFAAGFVFSCSEDAPSPVATQETGSPKSDGGPPLPIEPDYTCNTKACIESVLGSYSAGDILYIEAGTYEWDVDETGEFELDKTITIYGDGNSTILKKTAGSSTDNFFRVTGTSTDLTMRAMKLVATAGPRLIFAGPIDEVWIDQITIDCWDNGIQFSCNNLLFENCDVETGGAAALIHTNPYGNAFTHVVENSTFIQIDGSNNVITQGNFQAATGSVTYDGNEFSGQAAADYYHNIFYLSTSSHTLTLNIENNDLSDYGLHFAQGSGTGAENVVINYDDNHETASQCDIAGTIDTSEGNFNDVDLNIGCWVYDTDGHTYCEDVVITEALTVEFLPLDCKYKFEWETNGWSTSVVDYGQSGCSSLTGTVTGASGTSHVVYLDATPFMRRERIYYEATSVNSCDGTDSAVSDCSFVTHYYCIKEL